MFFARLGRVLVIRLIIFAVVGLVILVVRECSHQPAGYSNQSYQTTGAGGP